MNQLKRNSKFDGFLAFSTIKYWSKLNEVTTLDWNLELSIMRLLVIFEDYLSKCERNALTKLSGSRFLLLPALFFLPGPGFGDPFPLACFLLCSLFFLFLCSCFFLCFLLFPLFAPLVSQQLSSSICFFLLKVPKIRFFCIGKLSFNV